MQVVGRLAPSPTGLMHLGHARSFLLAWCSVRAQGGLIRLRMEDLDTSRVRPEFVDACLQDLEWLGLDWDGPVELQSTHAAEFQAVAKDLLKRGLAYPCICTRKEIELSRSAPHAEDACAIYPGTCRDRFATLEQAQASGRQPALRLRVAGANPTVRDYFAGEWTEDLATQVGDFPITSRDGQVAYQLAVVLDDARQGITEVLRGDDLLDSTPRQAFLQERLGLPRPRWIHVPLVLDEVGQRLAKRHDGLSLRSLREDGVDPARLVAWLAQGAGQTALPACRPEDLIPAFDLAQLPQSPIQLGSASFRALKAQN